MPPKKAGPKGSARAAPRKKQTKINVKKSSDGPTSTTAPPASQVPEGSESPVVFPHGKNFAVLVTTRPRSQQEKLSSKPSKKPVLRQSKLNLVSDLSLMDPRVGEDEVLSASKKKNKSSVRKAEAENNKKKEKEPLEESLGKSGKSGKKTARESEPDLQLEQESENEGLVQYKGKKKASKSKFGKKNSVQLPESESEDAGDEVAPVSGKKRGRSTKVSNEDNNSNKRRRDMEETRQPPPSPKATAVIEDDSDDDLPVSSGRRVRRPSASVTPAKPVVIDNSDDEILTSAARRGRKQPAPLPTQKVDQGGEKDLQEDLELASRTPKAKSRTRSAAGARPKKKPYQRQLDELRAKREGRELTPEDSSDESEPKKALYDTDSDDSDDEEDEDDDGQVIGRDSDEDDDDWIVEDDDGPLGAPEHALPLQFTQASHLSSRDYFEIYCKWIMKSLLTEGNAEKTELELMAERNLDTRTDTYGTSVLTSSAWKPAFMKAFKARPIFEYCEIDPIPGCDACKVSSRSSTFRVEFKGEKYDAKTLRSIIRNESSSESESEPQGSGGVNIFCLGKFCFQNSQMAHQLHHWKRQLFDTIHEKLADAGFMRFPAEELRKLMSKRTQDMNDKEFSAWLDDIIEDHRAYIRQLYRDYDASMQTVQNTLENIKMDRRSGGAKVVGGRLHYD